MNKSKIIFIISLTILMLIGLTTITATDIDTNDTTTITETTQPTIETPIPETREIKTINYDYTNKDSSRQTDSVEETDSEETLNDKIGSKTQNLKAGSITVTATDYTELNSYLTNGDYDTVTINIGDDIQLEGSITVNSIIKNLTINGNGKTSATSNSLFLL